MTDLLPVAAVVPVLDPEPGLLPLCEALVSSFAAVLVVDDGSIENADAFARLPEGVTLLRHERNRGKGCAIRTALGHLVRTRPDVRAVVFTDGDGQHRPEDVVAVARRALERDRTAFGVRDFSAPGVPFRSWWGNRWTAVEVRLLFGLDVTDTQTGLRAFPSRLFERLLALRGDRFEYEARIFRLLAKTGEDLEQVPIATVYLAGNRASHFRPLADTLLTQLALFT